MPRRRPRARRPDPTIVSGPTSVPSQRVLLLGCAFAIAVCAIVGGVLALSFYRFAQRVRTDRSPGERAFARADATVERLGERAGFGDDDEAAALATRFSEGLLQHVDAVGGSLGGDAHVDRRVVTHCRRTDEAVVFIAHISWLRDLGPDARAGLADAAWATARETTSDRRPPTLAVALRSRRAPGYYGPIRWGPPDELPERVDGKPGRLYRFYIEPGD